ncbi:MAG: AAA family ATPase [Magnetococcales bacterium]|nr:AAA family ATPase [Magnetococcales bacterium]MBF0262550.1 AAA family ATPase [Magnetococcales bacterium]
MISGIMIRNFRSIRELDPPLKLDRFHVLVGPNGSGKSTFLDAIDFVRDCLLEGPQKAVESRGAEFRDLTWMRQGGTIEIGLWIDIGQLLEDQKDSILNYQLKIIEDPTHGVSVSEEILRRYSKRWLAKGDDFKFSPKVKPKRLLGKTSKGTDYFSRENSGYQDVFVFGLDRLALSNTPPDEARYPTANAVKRFLLQGVRFIQLNSRAMRHPCPATRSKELELDGTNLARVVGRLLEKSAANTAHDHSMQDHQAQESPLEAWTDHLRYALPELKEIRWDQRKPDNAEYIELLFEDGLKCPSWLVSDGTLRMMALTLPAFLKPEPGIYMVEEPENGVHPKALEIIMSALSAIPRIQMLVATHSPFVVQQVGREPLLCFSRSRENGTMVVPGPQHPVLRNWDGTPDLATIFSSGVLEA